MGVQEEGFGWSVQGPVPSEAPGKATENWRLREDGQMQTRKLRPETKERDITLTSHKGT